LVQSSAIKQQRKAVVEKKSTSGGQQLTIGQRVAQTSKDVSYAGIIVLGIGVTGLMFYTVGKELFSSNSPNGIYTNALKLCKNNVQIQDALGTPIKGYGEMTRRKRRRHVSHLEYSQNGVNFMRMKFYLEGPHRKATVHLEMKQNENGRYEYRYLFVELDGYPSGTIILEDNR
ncbi:mitochondrial import inner membrane translocase subunit Tim21-like, partial [Diadema antillarum]